MSDINCVALKRNCNCGYYFGRDEELKQCPHCNLERQRCSKPKAFKWVKEPESGRFINTGFRYETCIKHGNRKGLDFAKGYCKMHRGNLKNCPDGIHLMVYGYYYAR